MEVTNESGRENKKETTFYVHILGIPRILSFKRCLLYFACGAPYILTVPERTNMYSRREKAEWKVVR